MDELAIRVRDLLASAPSLPVANLAEQLKVAEHEIVAVLDEYEVLDDGTIRHNGPGQGGGWVKQLEDLERAGTHIGYRWLDGSMHEEPDPEIVQMISAHQAQDKADE